MASEFQEVVFDEIIEFASEKVTVDSLTLENYISTENMIPNKGGVILASSLPSSKSVNKFVKGDTLFSNIRTYFEKVHFVDFDGGASPDVLIFRTKNTLKLLPEYLYYIASNKDFIDFTVRTSKGAKMPRGDKGAIQSHRLLLPSLSTQQTISDILRTLDKKTELNRQINQTLEEMAQAIFKSWFVDFDPVKAKVTVLENGGSQDEAELAAMEVISGKTVQELEAMQIQHPDQYQQLQQTASLFPSAMQDSELGEIPAGWEIKLLGDCDFDIESGKRPKGGIDKSLMSGVPSVGAESIAPVGQFNFGNVKYITEEFASKAKKGWVKNYDVALYKDGGQPGLFKPRVALYGNGFPYDSFLVNEHVFLLRSQMLGQPFLYHLISSQGLLEQLIAKGSAKAAQPGLNQTEVKTSKFVYANPPILEVFNNMVKPMLDQQLLNGKESLTLAELRDALLPKLLSGELQISTEDAV